MLSGSGIDSDVFDHIVPVAGQRGKPRRNLSLDFVDTLLKNGSCRLRPIRITLPILDEGHNLDAKRYRQPGGVFTAPTRRCVTPANERGELRLESNSMRGDRAVNYTYQGNYIWN